MMAKATKVQMNQGANSQWKLRPSMLHTSTKEHWSSVAHRLPLGISLLMASPMSSKSRLPRESETMKGRKVGVCLEKKRLESTDLRP